MAERLTPTPLAERARQLHERLTSGDVRVLPAPRQKPSRGGARRPLVPPEQRGLLEAWIRGGETAEAIAARFGVSVPQVLRYASDHQLPAPPRATPEGPIRGERIPIPQRTPAGPGPLIFAGSATAPSAPPESPGGPRTADPPPEVSQDLPPAQNAPQALLDALEQVQWLDLHGAAPDSPPMLSVSRTGWYLSASAVRLIGAPPRVRIGRLPQGIVVIAPASATDVRSLALSKPTGATAGRSLSSHSLRGVLEIGRYAVRAEQGWLVVAGGDGRG